jgi:MFS family permease
MSDGDRPPSAAAPPPGSDGRGRIRLSARTAFVAASYTLWIVLLGGTIPTPLYPIYETQFHFSSSIVTVIFAVYATGVLVGLLLLARASDTIGRRPLILLGVALGAASSLAFIFADGITALLVARVLSGFSVGLVTSTATAALTELEPEGDRARASRMAGTLNLLGLASGPLLAGLLAEYAPAPTALVFWIDIALLVPAAGGILLVRETAPLRGQGTRLTVPRIRIPPQVRAVFAVAAVVVFAGFAVAGLFSALAGQLLHSTFAVSNLAIVGGAVFLLFGSAAVAQRLWSWPRWGSPMAVGLGTLLVGVVLNLLALVLRSPVAFWSGIVVSGTGFGLGFLGSLQLLNEESPPERRGEVLSAFFVVAYVGLSVPIVGVGLIADVLGLDAASEILSAVVIGLLVVGLEMLRRNLPSLSQGAAA